jgi:diacylglycerol kinase family enzyme
MNWGCLFRPNTVAAALAFGRTITFWPGQTHGPDGVRLFVQMLGVDFDAHVVHHVPIALKTLLGKNAYVIQSIQELSLYKFPVIRMMIDQTETEAGSASVSKGRVYGAIFGWRLTLFRASRSFRPGRPLRGSDV